MHASCRWVNVCAGVADGQQRRGLLLAAGARILLRGACDRSVLLCAGCEKLRHEHAAFLQVPGLALKRMVHLGGRLVAGQVHHDEPVDKEVVESEPRLRVESEQSADELAEPVVDGVELLLRCAGLPVCGRLVGGVLVEVCRECYVVAVALDALVQLDVVVGLEGRAAAAHFVEDGAGGPEVSLGVVLLVVEDLGCHV